MGINVPGTKLNRFAECKMRIKLAQWMSAAELNVVMIKLVIQSTTIPGAVARYVDFPVRNNSLLLVTPVQNLGLNSMVEQVCQAEKTSSQADVKGQAERTPGDQDQAEQQCKEQDVKPSRGDEID